MKTSTLSFKNTSIYYIVGFISVLLTSCGSYQNSSYYDSDGIYGTTSNRTIETRAQNTPNNQYKDYFGSLQNNQPVKIFTDVENYNDYSLENDTLQYNDKNYPGWGSNPQSVSVNFYNTGWGINNWYGNYWYGNNWYGNNYYGNGWYRNNWYGNNWGWNSGFGWGMNIGFGWNNWYGNNWYGNNWGHSNYYDNRTRSYNSGRRGATYNNSANGSRVSGSYYRTQDNTISRRAINQDYRQNNDFNRNSSNRVNRTAPTFSRNQATPQNNNQSAPSSGNINKGRIESNSPSRSYTPTS